MLQAREAAERRLWSHPQEPTTEEWWADVTPTREAAMAAFAKSWRRE
jgi:hypothetical protein